MIMGWLAFIFSPLLFYGVRAAEVRWDLLHQSDYDVIMEIVELKWFNNSHFKNIKTGLVFYNRTQKVINCSVDLLKDVTRAARVEVQAYKFASNEYRFFPMAFSFNLCHEFERNSFGCKDLLKRTSNITHFPIQKGSYYVANALVDFSKLPPFIPRGRYKLECKMLEGTNYLAELHIYAEIKDKPLIA